jgi:hypothetical protein
MMKEKQAESQKSGSSLSVSFFLSFNLLNPDLAPIEIAG